MKVKLRKWDASLFLKNQEMCDEYLRLAFRSGDSDHIMEAIGEVAKAQKRWSQVASETGLDRSGLYRAFKNGGNPSASSMLKVMTALGYSLTPQRMTPEMMANYC